MSTTTYMQSCDVLGSTAEFRIVTEDAERVDAVFQDLWETVFDFEQRFSRFLHDSELTAFNLIAGERVDVSIPFRAMLTVAKQYGECTNGLFNPFILPDLVRAGYGASMTDGGSPVHSLYASRTTAPIEALEIGDTWARIPKGTALDLGGIGKGYLADRLGEQLAPFTNAFCLSLGGDMKVSGEEPDSPWSIEVESSGDRKNSIGTYTHPSTSSYGIATSGTERMKRRGTQAHLIDPKTGVPPVTQYRTCTVVAKDAVAADVFASCILIEGVELANRLFGEHHVDAILLQGTPETTPRMWGEGFHLEALLSEHRTNTHPTYA